jgi:EAL domain-containing protein (putative c-di-GMP-specific phosphodiesterase class I)
LDNYLNLLKINNTEVVVNFIETEAMLRAVQDKFSDKIFGYQGWGIRRPDLIENYINLG